MLILYDWLINDSQYGCSNGDLLVYLNHCWAAAITSKGEGLALFLDMAKAFDRVWHGALLAKLPSYGLSENLCKWIACYLTGRSIKVVVEGFCSECMPVNAGVPQGCVLSPTLFLLHINDMLKDSSIHCYADDSTVDAVYSGRTSLSRENAEQCWNKLVSSDEASLENVSIRGKKNLVQCNPLKTQVCALTTKKPPFVVLPVFHSPCSRAQYQYTGP